jgi:hypothetical protein
MDPNATKISGLQAAIFLTAFAVIYLFADYFTNVIKSLSEDRPLIIIFCVCVVFFAGIQRWEAFRRAIWTALILAAMILVVILISP